MLPPSLIDSYKQYKQDSNYITAWLADTAQKCGYPADLLINSATPQQKPPKLKGRARKLARDAANSANASQNTKLSTASAQSAPKNDRITTQEFISLAEYISSSTKPVITIPQDFVSVLDRTIVVRRRHNNWWTYSEEAPTQANQNSNNSHGFFIGVLEKVREILRPRMPTQMTGDLLAKPVDTPGSKAETRGLVNLFENLTIEEPSTLTENIESTASANTSEPEPASRFVLQQSTDLEEVYFAVHCFFNDLYRWRQYLQHVWDGYQHGAFDLVAVSLTTNTAIEFVRGLQEEFEESFPQHTDFGQHINVLYVQQCLALNCSPLDKEYATDEMNFEAYDAAETTFFPVFMFMSSFIDVIVPGELPVYKSGHWGVYDPSSVRDSKTSREKFREDKIVLLELLPEFCALVLGHNTVPAEDELTRGMRDYVRKKQLPMWLVFAAQALLDVHHILRSRIELGYNDLVKSAKYVEANINQALKFHVNLRIDTWPKSNDLALSQILREIKDWVKTDMVMDFKAKLLRRSPVQVENRPFLLYRQHPLFCGLLSFRIKSLGQEAGIAFANAWGSITYCAHLYNALQQEQLLKVAWPDMDLALTMHRAEDIFIGDRPKTKEDFFKRFTLAMGYSATMFAKDRRQTRVVASKSGPRCLNDLSPICQMFKKRYCENEARLSMTTEDINTILQKKADCENDDKNDTKVTERKTPTIEINMPEEGHDERTHPKAKKPRNQKHIALSPILLLNALLSALQSEMLELSFDHFRLHTFSWRLLRDVQKDLDEEIREIYGAGYLERENQLPFVVGYIFMTALNTSRLAGLLLPKKQNIVTSKLLVKAAETMQVMLSSGEGSMEITMLRKYLGMKVVVEDD